MKSFKRTLSLGLASFALVGALAGCGSGAADDPNTLILKAVDLGFGVEWLYELADAYHEKNPDVNFEITPYPGQNGIQAIQAEMESLTGDTDIFYTRPSNYHKTIYMGAVNTKAGKYDCAYEDLTDIWTTPFEGENGATIESKTDPRVADYLKVNGKYYGLNWADGFMGIVRNKNAWEKLGLTEDDVPLTTNQLFALCDRINASSVNTDGDQLNDIAPFIYSKSEEYYTSVWAIWAFQYDGIEAENNFINGLDPAGEFSEYLFSYPGMKKSLSFIQGLLAKDGKSYKYQHKDSDSLSFTEMQSYFFLDQAVFCVNGSWLEIEANKGKNPKQYNADFIKAPVISDLVDRLETVEDDDKLAEVIKFVDAHPDEGDNAGKPEYASDKDVERVREARSIQQSRSARDHTAMIPAWSKKKELAKDFLKYMYSDEGLGIYYKTQGGMLPPAKTSTGTLPEITMSTFATSANDGLMAGKFTNQSFCYKSKIFNVGGVRPNFTNNCSNYVTLFTQEKPESVDYIIKANTEYLQGRWSQISAACK